MDAPPPPPPDHAPGAVPAPGPPSRRVRPLVLVVIGVLALAGVGAAIVASSGADPSTPSGSVAASATTSPSPVPPASPANLKAKPGAFRVFLAWEEVVDGGTEPVSYRITRDGELLTMVSAGTSSFVDDVTPFTTYEYGIVALDADGVESSAATVTTETMSAPPATARVSGFFDVTLRETSHFGFSSISDEPVNQGWRIIPGCDEGLCDVKLSVIGVKEAATTLKRMQGGYQGSFQSNEFVRCGASGANATFTIRFKVTRADVVKGQWRATKIAGTVIQRSPAQLGCVSSGADYDATGTLTQQ